MQTRALHSYSDNDGRVAAGPHTIKEAGGEEAPGQEGKIEQGVKASLTPSLAASVAANPHVGRGSAVARRMGPRDDLVVPAHRIPMRQAER